MVHRRPRTQSGGAATAGSRLCCFVETLTAASASCSASGLLTRSPIDSSPRCRYARRAPITIATATRAATPPRTQHAIANTLGLYPPDHPFRRAPASESLGRLQDGSEAENPPSPRSRRARARGSFLCAVNRGRYLFGGAARCSQRPHPAGIASPSAAPRARSASDPRRWSCAGEVSSLDGTVRLIERMLPSVVVGRIDLRLIGVLGHHRLPSL